MAMMRMRLTYSACVAQSNTAETDALPEVLHKVWCANADGSGECEVLVMAADPMAALEKVVRMSEMEFAGLERATEQAAAR